MNTYQIHKKIKRWFLIIFLAGIVVLFLPWTQNIKVKGNVSTLYQQRPQQLNSPIPGKTVKWYVKNGDQVKKGDTLLQLAEIKEDYLDPLLVERTQLQVNAKKGVQKYYEAKVGTTNKQLLALNSARDLKNNQLNLKIGQLNNKLAVEKAELTAITHELGMSEDQYARQKKCTMKVWFLLPNFSKEAFLTKTHVPKKLR